MNNPYRARPTRSRVDHSAAYGMHNQNMWVPMSKSSSDVSPNTTTQQPPSIVNQSKPASNTWTDVWDWSVDQSSDSSSNNSYQQQLQQPPIPQHQAQQQQQQHYIASYPNKGQVISNPIQDHYYKNVNTPDVLNQNSVPDRNSPRSESTHQIGPNHVDSFSPYTNYNQNQQYPLPPQQNPMRSGYEHSQWPNERHPQNLALMQQINVPQDQSSAQRPIVQHNYNWNKDETLNIGSQCNWQKQTDVQGQWQDPNMQKKAQHIENVSNQCMPPAQQIQSNISSQMYHAPIEEVNQERSANWSNRQQAINEEANRSNVLLNQWHNQNSETTVSHQSTHLVRTNSIDDTFNSWSQSGNINIPQEWKHSNLQADIHPNQWLQQDNSSFKENMQDNNNTRFAANEWQMNQPHTTPFQYPSVPIMPINVESNVHISKNNERQENEKHAIMNPFTNTILSHDTVKQVKSCDVKSQNICTKEHHNLNMTDGTSNTEASKNPINESKDSIFASTIESKQTNDLTEELSSNLGQLNLGNVLYKDTDHQAALVEDSSVSAEGTAAQHLAGNLSVTNIRNKSLPDNIPVLPLDYSANSIEDSDIIGNQPVSQSPTLSMHQNNATKTTDGASKSGYDQWYNQNQIPNSIENMWYVSNHSRQPKQWNADQNVENYENIQQTSEFVNVEVVSTILQERDIYGSRESINKETLDNDPKMNVSSKETNIRDFREEAANVEVPLLQQQVRPHSSVQSEQMPDNYEFASNDRNTFLETGELTDSHQEHEPTPPSQDDENDEVPNDIPFLREVPGQSSSMDPRRNDPTGQEQYIQTGRLPDPRRNDPSGQEQSVPPRGISDRVERRDVPPGQERNVSLLLRGDSDTLERRNDPSGRERSLPPQQSRNDPSGEERHQVPQSQIMLELNETREVPGRGNELEEVIQQTDAELRQIPGGAFSTDVTQLSDDRTSGRVVTGSQEVSPTMSTMQDQASDLRNKREEAVGASLGESQGVSILSNRRGSYEDEDEGGSGNSREDSRERRREGSPDRRRYDYDRKNVYYDRDREYDDYYYDRRRVSDNERSYNARDDFERREVSYRDDDRKHHSRDDLDRHTREDMDRRIRGKDDLDERDGRRIADDRRRDKVDDLRRRDRDPRDYDPRYSRDARDREYMDRERRRDDRRSRRYDDYDIRDSYRRDYYDDPYGRSSRPSSRSSYNDRDREYYMRARDPYYAYNAGYGGYDYAANNYYAYLENLRRTNPAAYSEWYHKYYANQQQQQQHIPRGVSNYPEDRASVHSGRSSCDDRFIPIPSACFHSPNKALYVSYFGYPGWSGSLWQRNMTGYNFNRTTTDKRTLGEISLSEDAVTASARLTPTKYSTSHAYGSFSVGCLIHVRPSYPADGERAKVDIFRVNNLLSHDHISRDLRLYPGPLINGVTHKKTIIEYCENKIKKAVANEEMINRASYILLYEFMIMLIQQNGNVVGVDIAALLLRNKDAYLYDTSKSKSEDIGRRESVISQRSGATGSEGSTQDISTLPDKVETKQQKTVEQITDEFRNTLLYGLVQEALEYAMNEGLWGHALFLASKLDKRTYASVMTRFANSLSSHDPLQTLYQLHSGRVPAIVTSVADRRWDDWRPHLAMIISNTSANPEINRRSITTLGDTLSARGDIHAAHFCYILAQIDFGVYGTNGAKLVLIGANHNKPYSEFFTTEAVMLTEIYEYARNLSDPYFSLVNLQTFKFDLAVKMVDCGLIEKALLYIEQIATNITNDMLKYKKSFIKAVYTLGDRIKYHDPICKDSIEDATNLTWLNKLEEIVGKYQDQEVAEDETYNSPIDSRNALQNQETHETKQQQQSQVLSSRSQQQWNTVQTDYNEGPISMMEVNSGEMQSDWQPMSLPTNIQDTYDPNMQYIRNVDESVQYQQPQQWNQSYYQNNYGRNEPASSNWQQQSTYTPGLSDQTEVDSTQQQEKWNYEDEREGKTPTPESLQPNISITPSMNKQYDPLEELDALETPKSNTKSVAEVKKTTDKTAEKKPTNSGGSWFGGFFSKLAPKPKNQMILPDDSNPTIVWDPVGKKWMNKDEDGESATTALVPPPKMSDMSFRAPTIERSPQPPLSLGTRNEDISTLDTSKMVTASNMFKLQKGRSMRANYVDIMNPGGLKSNATSSNMPTPATSPLVPMAASSPQLFVPTPPNDPNAPMDFLTTTTAPLVPSAGVTENTPQTLSRWSSTSSLSREVQSYTMRDPCLLQRNKGPIMFNPSMMKDHSVKNMAPSRYPPR